MGEQESALAELAATDGVKMVCVFAPDGRLLSSIPKAIENTSWIEFLQAWCGHPCLSWSELKEMAFFYPNSLVLWRRVGENRTLSDGSTSPGEASYRNILLVAEPATSLSLLRVSLDVKEHGWRALGIHKVFPSSAGKGSEGGILSKLFRRPSH